MKLTRKEYDLCTEMRRRDHDIPPEVVRGWSEEKCAAEAQEWRAWLKFFGDAMRKYEKQAKALEHTLRLKSREDAWRNFKTMGAARQRCLVVISRIINRQELDHEQPTESSADKAGDGTA